MSNSNMDQFAEKVKEVAEAAGKVAGEVIDTSKGKLRQMQLNSELKDAYARLGSVVYESRKKDIPNEKLIGLIMGEIDALRQDLDQVDPVETHTPAEVYCPTCGATNEKGFSFCCKCGAALHPALPE